jgi:hypothetical protein
MNQATDMIRSTITLEQTSSLLLQFAFFKFLVRLPRVYFRVIISLNRVLVVTQPALCRQNMELFLRDSHAPRPWVLILSHEYGECFKVEYRDCRILYRKWCDCYSRGSLPFVSVFLF